MVAMGVVELKDLHEIPAWWLTSAHSRGLAPRSQRFAPTSLTSPGFNHRKYVLFPQPYPQNKVDGKMLSMTMR